MIKHAESANDVSRLVEIRKIAEVVEEVERTKIKDSSGESVDSSTTTDTSTVINANCSCFCTIKDALFKLFRRS